MLKNIIPPSNTLIGTKNMQQLSQEISFSKMHNFRELGGYKAFDGRHVKHNIFFRSPALCQLETKEDFEKFKSFGIKTIYDFRSHGERNLKPDPKFEGVDQHEISALYDADGSEINFDFRGLESLTKEQLADVIKKLNSGYGRLGIENPAYISMFKDICSGNVPILFHCSAGKDRTGVAAALILSLFGVDKEDIYFDYLKTNDYNSSDVLKKALAGSGDLSPEHKEALKSLSGVNRKSLENVFDIILQKYGTMENYFEKEFGITPDMRKKLMDMYLE